ncbi:hypothetical protein ANANG_G00114690, partial [Anguilla anguilla]
HVFPSETVKGFPYLELTETSVLKSIQGWFFFTALPIFFMLMEALSMAVREIGDPSLPVSSLCLLVPPLQLLSAAMWQVLQKQDVLHYGKLEEFVSLVMETFPELLSESQRTELTLGLQYMSPAETGCKTDPALEVLLWEFLSRLDQLLLVPDLKQTVSWLSAAPSVVEVCVQSVSYTDNLKTLLRHHRSLGQLDMNVTLPSIEECKLFSMSRPPSQRVMDSTKLTNTNSQSDSITNCMKFLSSTPSDEDIKAEIVMDSTDYEGVEPMSSLNRCEDMDQRTQGNTEYLISRAQKDLLTNMKEEEENWERQSVKMEREDGVRDEEGLWKQEDKERDEQREGYLNGQAAQTGKLMLNGVKSQHGQQEGEGLSTAVTSCLVRQPRVLIRRIEIGSSVPVSLPCSMVTRLRTNRSLRQKKGPVVTRKRKTIGQLEKPLNPLSSSSENRICAEAFLISPVISPRNQNTGQTVEVSSQVFACSQYPFIHTQELNRTVGSQQPTSTSNQHPIPPKTPPKPTLSHTGTPGPHTCSQCGKSFAYLSTLKRHQWLYQGRHQQPVLILTPAGVGLMVTSPASEIQLYENVNCAPRCWEILQVMKGQMHQQPVLQCLQTQSKRPSLHWLLNHLCLNTVAHSVTSDLYIVHQVV